jgi:hypothetical protein
MTFRDLILEASIKLTEPGSIQHLTATNTKAIKAILDAGLESGKVGKIEYYLKKVNDTDYELTIKQMDRGLGMVGDKLRLSTYKGVISVK